MRKNISKVVFVVVAIVINAPAFAQRANDQDMADSALFAHFRHSDTDEINRSLERARSEMDENYNVPGNKSSRTFATIIFNEGLSADEVSSMLTKLDIELATAESKTAVGENGQVITMSVGARDLHIHPGSIADKLKIATGAQQFSLLSAYERADAENASNLFEVISTPVIDYYKVDVVGDFESIYQLLSENSVMEVIPDYSGDALENYNLHRSFAAQIRETMPTEVVRVPLEDGVPPNISREQILRTITLPSSTTIQTFTGSNR